MDTQESFGLDIEILQINHQENQEKSTIFVTALPLSVAAADFISMTMFYYLNKCINGFITRNGNMPIAHSYQI